MKFRPADQLKLMLLLLALGLADSTAIAESEPRRLLDKDHLKGDFGPHAKRLFKVMKSQGYEGGYFFGVSLVSEKFLSMCHQSL